MLAPAQPTASEGCREIKARIPQAASINGGATELDLAGKAVREMLELPAEHCALIAALSVCLMGAQAGVLMPDGQEDPDALAAALETASRRVGVVIRHAWLDDDRMTLAWLRADDVRLVADPELAILGVMI